MRTALNCVVILASLFLLFGLAYLGLLIPGALVIAGLDAVLLFLIFLLTGKKEEVNSFTRKAGKYCKDRAEVFGEVGREGAGVLAKVSVETARTAGTFIKTAYDEMGGREGAEKAVKGIAKGTEEVLKIAATGVIELGKAGAHVVQHAVSQIEAGSQERETKSLEDNVDAAFRIIDSLQEDDD
ncbi:MAG: hypothetical protein LBQ89_02265 [Treponema sp.]|jgi:hypothetical protein|nr:hypothetical protein [Treponema sp.]